MRLEPALVEVGQAVFRVRGRDQGEAAQRLGERPSLEMREGVLPTAAQLDQSLGLGPGDEEVDRLVEAIARVRKLLA